VCWAQVTPALRYSTDPRYDRPIKIWYNGETDLEKFQIFKPGFGTTEMRSYSSLILKSSIRSVEIIGGSSSGSFQQSVDMYGGTTNLGYRLDNTGRSAFTSNAAWINSLGLQANDKIVVDGFNLAWKNSTAVPSNNIADHFRIYSEDITAGNAAPHFRTENGAIVKLYQETTGVAAATLVGNAGTNITDTDTFDGYTLKQVVKVLRNLGILA